MSSKGEKVENPSAGKEAVRNEVPGWAKMQSTSAFRAINFELFVRPNKYVMVVGATLFLGSLGYITYMNLTNDSRKKMYVTVDEDGGLTSRPKVSKWQ